MKTLKQFMEENLTYEDKLALLRSAQKQFDPNNRLEATRKRIEARNKKAKTDLMSSKKTDK